MSSKPLEADREMESEFDTMSDEDFLNQEYALPSPKEETEQVQEPAGGILEDRLSGPAEAAEGDETDEDTATAEPEGDDKKETTPTTPDADADAAETPEGSEAAESDTGENHTTPNQSTSEESEDAGEAAGEGEGGGEEPAEASGETNYKALYEQMMSPFKANGKEFKPESPEDVVRLMQMGANYTKKMQALKPNLKLMRMLDNNGLLDENKLSFLIDLEKKNPQAIQKLLHDSQVDPLEIDTEAAPDYVPGNHRVTDEEMNFQEVLTDVVQRDTGRETVSLINRSWDTYSKDAIYNEPALLSIIDDQRANGIYDLISTEIERRQTLGQIPPETPFIQSYRDVGNELQRAGKLGTAPTSGSTAMDHGSSNQRQILESRPAKPSKTMANGDKAKAVSSAPKAAAPKRPDFDPFSMSDEEIMAIPSPKV